MYGQTHSWYLHDIFHFWYAVTGTADGVHMLSNATVKISSFVFDNNTAAPAVLCLYRLLYKCDEGDAVIARRIA